jgi:hypothetical protein
MLRDISLGFYRCARWIEVGHVDIRKRRSNASAVDMIPNRIPNETGNDAPIGQPQLPDGLQAGKPERVRLEQRHCLLREGLRHTAWLKSAEAKRQFVVAPFA